MVTPSAGAQLKVLEVRVTQEVFPPRHEMHGTPHQVVQRLFTFELTQGTAEVDQTDYGHPGRFNPCHARRMPAALQPKTNQIVAAAGALATLLG